MNLKFLFNVSISFLAGISSLSAQEERPLEMVQLVYEVFSLEEKKAVATQRTNRTDIAAYQEMVTGLTNGEVVQEKLMALRLVPGEKAVTQHVSEMGYPTEFDPPELPNSVGLENFGDEGPSLEDLESGPGWQAGAFPATPGTGTAFQIVKLGDELEFEAELMGGNSGKLAIRMMAIHTDLKGFDAWGQGLAEAKMPLLSVQTVQSNIVLKSGVPMLVGTVSPPDVEQEKGKKKRVWFAFVTATLMEVEK